MSSKPPNPNSNYTVPTFLNIARNLTRRSTQEHEAAFANRITDAITNECKAAVEDPEASDALKKTATDFLKTVNSKGDERTGPFDLVSRMLAAGRESGVENGEQASASGGTLVEVMQKVEKKVENKQTTIKETERGGSRG
ncbi:hypothetical protein P7C71_g3183, partial [Lecanoromycetidae sp. Uapishka_2]